MIQYYKQGMFQTEICTKLHCKRETLLSTLNRAGVKVLSKSERNRKVDFNPFSLTTDESYYWLGYLIADGNIHKVENGISIVSKDLDHLNKWHNFTKNPGKIQLRKSGCGTSKFSNKEVKTWLISIGVMPNKTFTVDLNISLNWPIVRGLFDGDGCISIGKSPCVYLITGSILFREKLSNFLNSEDIKHTIQQHTNCWKIVISRKAWVEFATKMYRNKVVYLERKFERFRPILEKSNIANRMNSGEVLIKDNPEPSYTELISVEGAETRG